MPTSLNSGPDRGPLIRKLESIAALSDDERRALMELPMSARDIRADQDIVREGDRPSQCCLVIDGFLARYKLTPRGKRQIMAFHTPGDNPDLQSLHLRTMDHSLGTLSPGRVAFIPHEPLRALCTGFPRLAGLFWRDTLIDAAIFREWMVGIGRRSAYSRIAHVFCEVLVRLEAVGLTQDRSCAFPITQSELGDALGLSTVHVNRVLQELRADDLIMLGTAGWSCTTGRR